MNHLPASNRDERAQRFVAAVFGGDEHLDYESLELLVDGRMTTDQRQVAQTHLERCASCAHELDDLQSFVSGGTAGVRRPVLRTLAVAASIGVVIATALMLSRPAGRQSPPALVQLRDRNAVISLDREGRVRGVPADVEDAVRTVLLTRRLPRPHVPLPARTGDSLRGETTSAQLELHGPVAEVILDDRPLFRWNGGPQGSEFVVEVFDSRFHEIMRSAPTTEHEWRPERPLPRAQRLLWQVIATAGTLRTTAPRPQDGPAAFFIAEATMASRITRARVNGGHLTLATLYAQIGDTAAAERELIALQRLNGTSSDVAAIAAEYRSHLRR